MPARAAAWGLALVVASVAGSVPARAQPTTPIQLAAPHAHDAVTPNGEPLRATPDELALRAILLRYAAGDVTGAVVDLRGHPTRWTNGILDTAVTRLDEDLKYHARPANYLGPTEQARVERELRGDRLRFLQLTAAVQVDASRVDTTVDAIGWRILGGERAIDQLFRLRPDVDRNGPIAWPTVHAFAATWYGAAAARLQQLVEVTLGPALVARGSVRCPDDADLLIAQGAYAETKVALARVDASLDAVIWSVDERRGWRARLKEAADAYTRAIRLDPTRHEASIRLARVRLLEGDVAAARALLEAALATELPGELRYLARLFHAGAAEQSRDAGAAARDYEAARALRPDAPTPLLALSRLADADDRREEARTWADRAVTTAADGADPWRSYVQGQAWDLEGRMIRLRRLGEP